MSFVFSYVNFIVLLSFSILCAVQRITKYNTLNLCVYKKEEEEYPKRQSMHIPSQIA
jgi:hypothetical protein